MVTGRSLCQGSVDLLSRFSCLLGPLDHDISEVFSGEFLIALHNVDTQLGGQVGHLLLLPHFAHVGEGAVEVGESPKVRHAGIILRHLFNSIIGCSDSIIHSLLGRSHLGSDLLDGLLVAVVLLFRRGRIRWFVSQLLLLHGNFLLDCLLASHEHVLQRCGLLFGLSNCLDVLTVLVDSGVLALLLLLLESLLLCVLSHFGLPLLLVHLFPGLLRRNQLLSSGGHGGSLVNIGGAGDLNVSFSPRGSLDGLLFCLHLGLRLSLCLGLHLGLGLGLCLGFRLSLGLSVNLDLLLGLVLSLSLNLSLRFSLSLQFLLRVGSGGCRLLLLLELQLSFGLGLRLSEELGVLLCGGESGLLLGQRLLVALRGLDFLSHLSLHLVHLASISLLVPQLGERTSVDSEGGKLGEVQGFVRGNLG
mmetsp:Transcript_19195/g.32701  ORF Transcript_19195/g.32701 Transcript_19195/m.32701 type:complete len:416 (+) Transcript_19195:214-1461(+)